MVGFVHRSFRVFCFLAVVWVSASSPARSATREASPRVLTSFLPVHSLTATVAGDRALVENWLPPGIDPHDFQFLPRDIRRLRKARILLVGGLGLEGWKESRLRTVAENPDFRMVEVAAGIPREQLILATATPDAHAQGHGHVHDHDSEHDHDSPLADAGGAINPHFWLDPLLAAHAVTNILTALESLDPAGAEVYRRNARDLVVRLEALHGEFETTLKEYREVAFLTYHDAFPYLTRRYGLRLVGVVEPVAETSPSARWIADLSRLARENSARVLFTDGSPTRLARQMAADLGLKLATLETLETGKFEAGAYEAGMRRNLEALKRALGPHVRR